MTTKRSKTEGFTLIELLIVIIIIGILAAIAIPMFLAQRERAKDSVVKGGTHSIEIGIASWAIDHGDTYPDVVGAAAATTLPGGGAGPSVGEYVDNWPDNPWTAGNDMVDALSKGNYSYQPLAGRTSFTLAGHMSTGDFVAPH